MSTTTDEIELGTQITSPHGPGIVQWVDGPIYTVRIFSDPLFAPPRQLPRDQIDFWPPRKPERMEAGSDG